MVTGAKERARGKATDTETEGDMLSVTLWLGKVVHGGATPLVVIVGVVLIVVGVVMLFRGSVLMGALAIIVGILLGGLTVL